MSIDTIKKQIDEMIFNNNVDNFKDIFNYCMRIYRLLHKDNVKIYNQNYKINLQKNINNDKINLRDNDKLCINNKINLKEYKENVDKLDIF